MSEPRGKDDFELETTIELNSGETFTLKAVGNTADDVIKKMKALKAGVMAEDWGGPG